MEGVLCASSRPSTLHTSLQDIGAASPCNETVAAGCRVCESVAAGLVGQKLAGFTGISSAVKSAVEGALTRILTPKRSIDILREIAAAKAKGRPYTIVFVGVNGVGKSTNLAKVAYWLLQNNISVCLLTVPRSPLRDSPY